MTLYIDNLESLFRIGKDGGKAKGQCDIELIIPSNLPHRIQEGHQILYHSLCEWVDERVD